MTTRKSSKTIADVLHQRSVAELLWALATVEDPEWLRRICAELGRRRAVDAAEEIVRVLQRARRAGQWRLLEACIDALGRIGESWTGGSVVDVLRDSTLPVGVRDSAAFALAQMEYRPAIDALIASVSDSNRTVRLCAAAALARVGDGKARSRLELLIPAESDAEVRAALSRAVTAVTERAATAPGVLWLDQIRRTTSSRDAPSAQRVAESLIATRPGWSNRIVAAAQTGARLQGLNKPAAPPASWRRAMRPNSRLRPLPRTENAPQRFNVAF